MEIMKISSILYKIRCKGILSNLQAVFIVSSYFRMLFTSVESLSVEKNA
ncbi:hypothetical protein ANACOL_01012 [Anaerotruncus colihominis DSM 17241]|uniref:Uncharacterized protein n=1 Tax=Anaerotruncus colihominis DSM 17241 TaxID=445972 RepID=B0P8C3_9FIRM|nr:hypothetical protein ANACOL_01012 [Anaerotruncus colihominis DSM 17241]